MFGDQMEFVSCFHLSAHNQMLNFTLNKSMFQDPIGIIVGENKPNQTGHKIPNFSKWVTHSLPQFGDTEYNLHNLIEVSSCEEKRVELGIGTSGLGERLRYSFLWKRICGNGLIGDQYQSRRNGGNIWRWRCNRD